jgi:hypothetical protein
MTKIRSLLKPDEKIMTVGSYDGNLYTTYPPGVDGNIDWIFEFGWNNMTLRNSSTYSNFNIVFLGGKSSTVTDDFRAVRQYTLTTYDANKTKVLGQIMFSLNYIYEENPDASKLVKEFMVNGKSGIYENVVRVIVNFLPVRRLFFVVKKNQKTLEELLPPESRTLAPTPVPTPAPKHISWKSLRHLL